MNKFLKKTFTIISIFLVVFSIYRYNNPGIELDDIDYETIEVEVQDIIRDEGNRYAIVEIDGEERRIFISNSEYEIGETIEIYKYEDIFYYSEKDILTKASGAGNLATFSVIAVLGTITFCCLTGDATYDEKENTSLNFDGLRNLDKNSLEEEMKKLKTCQNAPFHPFTIMMWIGAAFFVIYAFIAPDKADFWLFYLFTAGIFFLIGKWINVLGSINYKCKKTLKEKGEVLIADCWVTDKNTQIDHSYVHKVGVVLGKGYYIKVGDKKGNVIDEWFTVSKKMYYTATEDAKLKLFVLRKKGLIKFFVV